MSFVIVSVTSRAAIDEFTGLPGRLAKDPSGSAALPEVGYRGIVDRYKGPFRKRGAINALILRRCDRSGRIGNGCLRDENHLLTKILKYTKRLSGKAFVQARPLYLRENHG